MVEFFVNSLGPKHLAKYDLLRMKMTTWWLVAVKQAKAIDFSAVLHRTLLNMCMLFFLQYCGQTNSTIANAEVRGHSGKYLVCVPSFNS